MCFPNFTNARQERYQDYGGVGLASLDNFFGHEQFIKEEGFSS